MPSSFTYNNGDGHAVLDSATPVGATDPVNLLDDSDQQIKKFLKDTTAGLAKILGPTGQLYLLRIGTSLPTPATGESYLFYKTDTGVLYLISDATLIPLMPGGGAAAGKILMSGGLASAATWSKMIPSRGIVECQTTLPTGAQTNYQMTLVASGSLPTGISIVSGRVRVANEYTVLIRGAVNGGVYSGGAGNTAEFVLNNQTGGSILQYGLCTGALTANYSLNASFDYVYVNNTGGNVDIELLYTSATGVSVNTASSNYPNARLIFEVHPN